MSMGAAKYSWIDFLRFAAAFQVVAGHATALIVNEKLSTGATSKVALLSTSFGRESVILFFVISGFWITRSVLRSSAAFSWFDYATARFSRLWIVLVPALVIGGLIDVVGTSLGHSIYAGTQGANSINFSVSDRLDIQTFVCNAAFLQTIACETFGSNGPLWSLAFEFWYYLAFPAFWLAVYCRRFNLLIVITLGLFVVNPGLASGFGVWLMGGVVQWLDNKNVGSRRFARLALLPSVLLVGIAIAGNRALHLNGHISILTIGASFAVFLYLLLAAQITFPAALRFFASYGADSSFSLYATHFPIMVFLASFITPDTRLAPSGFTALLVIALTLACLLYAYFFSLVTEKKTPYLKRALKGFLQARLS